MPSLRSLQLSSLLPRFRCDGHGLCSLGQPCVTRFSLPHVLGGGIVGYRAAGESRNFGKMATGYCIRNRRKASTTPGAGTRWKVEIRCYHDAGTSAPVHRCNGDSSIVWHRIRQLGPSLDRKIHLIKPFYFLTCAGKLCRMVGLSWCFAQEEAALSMLQSAL